jgi:uncharacterized protein YbjT (DUF2867 family)
MTILVTGASGNVGSALVEELISKDLPVRGAYRSGEKAAAARRRGVEAVTVDLDDPASLRPAVAGVEAVFLLGATGPRQVGQEIGVVRAAVAAGVGRLVKLSVWRAPDELTVFARVHRAVEREIEAAPMAWTLLRPNFFMQTFLARMGAAIRAHRSFAQPRLGAAAYIDTRDIARVAAAELAHPSPPGTVLSLTGPTALSYPDLARILSEVVGEPVSYREASLEDMRATLRTLGASSYLIDAVESLATSYRDGGAEEVTSTVQQIIGRPPTSFRSFLDDHAKQFR